MTDPETLHKVIAENSFATLITATSDEPFATHIPLILEGDQLVGHMAKANPHWNSFDGRHALAIFQGPHAYVSPSIYVTSPNVPTWNYVTVHVYGVPEVIEDPDESAAILYKSMAIYDPKMVLDEAFHSYLQKQLAGIVAFRMPIVRIEGKFKLNQNKKPEDRNAVMATFDSSERLEERTVAAAMKTIYRGMD